MIQHLDNEIFVAAVTVVEMVAAITRRARSGSLTTTNAALLNHQIRHDFQTDYQIVEITEDIIDSGVVFAEIYGLRGYDTVQLPAGCAVNQICIANNLPPMTLVSADDESVTR